MSNIKKMEADVIVATGGFGNNTKMIEQILGFKWGEDMFTFRIPGIDGEGMRMVWDVGGKRSNINMEVTYNTPGTTDIFKTLSETMRQPNLMVNLGGIQVNENMEVLDEALDPIPGLYACGTDSASMSYAINSGRIAGMERVDYMDSDRFVE